MSSRGSQPPAAWNAKKRFLTLALSVGLLGSLSIPAATTTFADSTGTEALVQLATERTAGLPSGRTTYRTITDYNDEMLALSKQHPDLVKHITLPHKTRQGREVYGIEVTHDVNAAGGKPVLLMMGIHHGNEWPSGEHTMEFAYDLVNNARKDRQVKRLLDQARVIFVPVVNVDGFVINRRTSCGLSPTCAGNAGVDINRNYPFGWGSNAGSNATSRGPGPGSEPEVQNIMELTATNQATVLITNHTSGHTLLRPPLEKRAGDAPDEAVYAALTDAMTAKNGYTGMKSGFDYETTGETPDWSYYATRGLGFTFEIMKTQSTTNTYTEVIEDYLGTGRYEGKSNREAFMVALEYAADPAGHSVIKGKAPKGAVLTITKDFDLWTAPILQAGGVLDPPQAIPTHLESSLVAPTNGKFTWHVNPSVRPTPAYTANGVVATGPGNFLRESWTLTCARPGGEVLETVNVTVDRGEQVDVSLRQCKEHFKDHGPKG
jgi:hypothetical protein